MVVLLGGLVSCLRGRVLVLAFGVCFVLGFLCDVVCLVGGFVRVDCCVYCCCTGLFCLVVFGWLLDWFVWCIGVEFWLGLVFVFLAVR